MFLVHAQSNHTEYSSRRQMIGNQSCMTVKLETLSARLAWLPVEPQKVLPERTLETLHRRLAHQLLRVVRASCGRLFRTKGDVAKASSMYSCRPLMSSAKALEELIHLNSTHVNK